MQKNPLTTYFLSKIKKTCEWRVVEQEKFVAIGKLEFTNEILSFYSTIEEAYKDGVDVILFGGSIGYVPDSYVFMEKAKATQAQYLIFDRTPTTNAKQDTFAVQYVPPSIYEASYPVRNFSHDNFIEFFNDEYELIEEWVCELQPNPKTKAMGFIFKRKSS